jgi:hypothetical protein
MEKHVKQEFETLERISRIFFGDEGTDIGPYTSPNPIKRTVYYRRLLNLLKIFPCDLDGNATIVDFGAGQCMFSILLLSLGYKNVLSVDINEKALQQGVSLLDFYNHTCGTDLALDISGEMPHQGMDLMCAIDVFEHFSQEYTRDIIQSRSSPRYLLNLPTENFLYNLGTGFRRESGHKTRYFDVIEVFKDCGFDITERNRFLGLFSGYLLERGG